ncbi:MAG: hotdog fold domain-containing protein [Euryarchaeota archaeon]
MSEKLFYSRAIVVFRLFLRMHNECFKSRFTAGVTCSKQHLFWMRSRYGNWTAAIALMDQSGDSEPPCTVTANYTIKLRRPTPFGHEIKVNAEVVELGDERAKVKMELISEGNICAVGEGLFVAVKEGHPAYHRWN